MNPPLSPPAEVRPRIPASPRLRVPTSLPHSPAPPLPRSPTPPLGFVSLVGAGPGDPELLTLRGARRLAEADAVVYDRLVDWDLLSLCRAEARLYAVGKTPGDRSWRQQDINALLIRLARAGLRVVRLKGGDPFVFGRGGEEALALVEAEIAFEVVPGVSSALAAPAAAGIPVTHRGLASCVTIATGHFQDGGADGGHDWDALARTRGTLVFLMAVATLEQIVAQLLRHGRPFDEPAALVSQATTARQQTARATLGTIAQIARAAEMPSPAVLVIGQTAALGARIRKEVSTRTLATSEVVCAR